MAIPIKEKPRRSNISLAPIEHSEEVPRYRSLRSLPYDPKQRVRNGDRTPEPVVNVVQVTNLTGTYFEDKGRYRLFINHVGKHLECLLTLVTRNFAYHKRAVDIDDDTRIPSDWGCCTENRKKRPPIAYRFAGDPVSNTQYLLRVPKWIGDYDARNYDENADVGVLQFTWEFGVLALSIDLTDNFRSRWPEHGQLESSRAVQTDTSPVLLERYLDRASVPWEVRTLYWFGMTPRQRKSLPFHAWRILTHTVSVDDTFGIVRDGAGTVVTLGELLRTAHQLPRDTTLDFLGKNILASIDKLVDEVFLHPHTIEIVLGGFGVAHADEFRVTVLRVLNAARLKLSTRADDVNLITALQRTLDLYDDGTKARMIRKHLELDARPFTEHHLKIVLKLTELVEFDSKPGKAVYKKSKKVIEEQLKEISPRFKQFKQVAKFLPVGYVTGHLTVSYDPPESDGPHEKAWSAVYGITLAGLRLSKGPGMAPKIEVRGTGVCYGASPPRPRDLEGVASYLRADLFAGLAVPGTEVEVSLGGAKSGLFLYGDPNAKRPVVMALDGEISNFGGAKAGGEAIFGYAWLIDGEGGEIDWMPDVRVSDPGPFESFWTNRIGELAVHFPINGARLPQPTQDEEFFMHETGRISVREALDAFTASELPLFAHPLSVIYVRGKADRPDTEARNLELSKNRAVSVRNYLEGLLGDLLTFGLSDADLAKDRLVVTGSGEGAAKIAGHDEKHFDVGYRRVDLKVAVRWGAPTELSTPEEAAKEGVLSTDLDLIQSSPVRR